MRHLLLILAVLLTFALPAVAALPGPALQETFGNEGGLTKDDGGWTKFGVSRNGYAATDQVRIYYTNGTAGGIAVSPHDITVETYQ